ncbi:SDR family oxidoreductase [Glutamicibacter sp.]|uniref:SDR family oxidoreductase n=1 Tax=Glutamicibacter sp. TaxID=1931995 RepID=UPI0028BD71EA|nr:SDR family oxidoreductase [Glutamicibacter sp.]
MTETPRVVILGGHGKVALLAAPKLIARGFSVDSLIRKQEQAPAVQATGANPVVLDIEHAGVDELAAAFEGAAAVVFSAGAGGGDPLRTNAVDYESAVRAVRAAKQSGVDRFVMVSYSRALVDVDVLEPSHSFYPYAKAKHRADAVLRDSGLDYTILGPGALTLEPGTGKITVADAQGKLDGLAPESTSTSRENVAEAIALVVGEHLLSSDTANFFDGVTEMEEAWR